MPLLVFSPIRNCYFLPLMRLFPLQKILSIIILSNKNSVENRHIYFPEYYTATILDWKALLKEDKLKNISISSLRYLVISNRIKLYAFVIMHNHIHLIWQTIEEHTPARVRHSFMKYTAQQIKFELIKTNPEFLKEFKVDKKDREYQFWKRYPLSIEIYTEKVFLQKIEYIHNNPVKAGLCKYSEDYQYSSASYYNGGNDRFEILSSYY